MPVLPLVASTTVWPGLSEPSRSAASITPSASRSLTEPSGLNASTLAYRLTPSGASLLMRTIGVLPIVVRMFGCSALMSAQALGPIVRARAVERLHPLVRGCRLDTARAGAKVIGDDCGGKRGCRAV